MKHRSQDLRTGILFGAWLGAVYAIGTMALNWVLMPGIPLKPFHGNTVGGYVFLFAVIGAVLGFISALPESPWLGTALGGLSSAFMITISGLFTSDITTETIIGLAFGFLYTFLPMAVLLMPVAWLIRAGVNAQHPDPDHPELWGRRYLIPGVLSLVVLGIGFFSTFDANQRDGFRIVHALIEETASIKTVEALPKSLQTVQGYINGRQGAYELSFSDDLENFMGPQPVSGLLSQFLVVAEFESGLSFACIFQAGVTVAPYCTNF
jgi:hypothetical protein